MVAKYNDDWAGRFPRNVVKGYDSYHDPMLAYRPYCKLSLGAGLQMRYIKARLRNSTLVKTPEPAELSPERKIGLNSKAIPLILAIILALCMNTAIKPVSA